MKLYGISMDNEFKEYEPQRFKDEHREQLIETWLEQNSKSIVDNGGLLIIGRQVGTNLNSTIDLLGLDREGNVAVVELKRDKTPRDVLAQAFEYASYAATLDGDKLEEIYRKYLDDENASLVESHQGFFSLAGEAVSFNKNQRMVIVGSEITPPVRQSASYLRQKGFIVTCLEFSYFQAGGGEQLISMDIVVGEELAVSGVVSTSSLPKTTEKKFLAECTNAGRVVFIPLLAMARKEEFPLHWGSRGFSLNLFFKGKDIPICFGSPQPTKPNQKAQSLGTAFEYIRKYVDGSNVLIESYKEKFMETGLFGIRGQELKYFIETEPTPEQSQSIVNLIRTLAREVEILANNQEN